MKSFTLTLSFLFALLQSVHAQDPNNLAVDGTVKDEDGGRITGAQIALYQDGAELKRVSTGNNGRFDLYLEFGHEYTIEISKPSYVTKKLYLNTNNVPVDEQLWGYEFGGFVVDMFKRMDGVDYSILDKPIGKVYYEPNVENFVDDKLYTRGIKAEVDRLEEAQKEKIKADKEREKRLEADYQLAIKDAQAAIDDGDYLLAKDNLLAAQSMSPSSKVASQMLSQVEAKLNSEGAAQQQYLSKLASADQAFGNNNFESAIVAYQQALDLKPSEDYPKKRLKESQDLFAQQKIDKEKADALAAKDKQYNDEIAKADAAYGKKEFLNARASYQNALKYKDDDYPKTKLKEIEIKLAELASAEQKELAAAKINASYADKLDKANAAFNSQNYDLAEQHYNAAIQIKPQEAYPKDQIELITAKRQELAEANRLKALKNGLDQDYQNAIASADKALESKDYESAKSSYRKALELKPKEVYPSEKLVQIDKELARLAALASENEKREAELKLEKNYTELIASGDGDFKKKDWVSAKANYQSALELKSNELYPKNQLALIDSEIKKASKLDEINSAYNGHIAAADGDFDRGEYAKAIIGYKSALGVKANESYPISRIQEAEAIIAEQQRIAQDKAAQAKVDENYALIIKAADLAFNQKDYSLATARYSEALKLKSDTYPSDRIDEIKSILAEQAKAQELAAKEAEIKEKYDEAILKADGLLAAKNYDEARATYNMAAGFKSNEAYPKNKISEIDGIVNSLAAEKSKAEADAKAKAEYENLLKRAQAEMDDEDYRAARSLYAEAKTKNPSDQFPALQIQKIDALIAETEAKENEEARIAAKKNDYDNFMRKGNEAMVSQDYKLARASYTSALAIYPNEEIPKSKISMIDELEKKAEQERIKTEYNRIIAIADKFFLEKDYEAALAKYTESLDIIQGLSHAQERIKKCNEMIAELSRVAATEEEDNKRRVIEETFDEGRTKVTIRKVSIGGREQVYKRVVHSWGGKYYFLDEQPITELVWSRETAK